MANTYTLIASSTVGSGGAASIEFTSIPSTYTDLLLSLSTRTSRTGVEDNLKLTINSVTGTSRTIRGYSSTADSTSSGGDIQYIYTVGDSATANTFGNVLIYIPNYTSSAAHPISIDSTGENNATTSYRSLTAGLTTTTSAITSISISSNFYGNFIQYSTAYLYGIRNS